MRRKPVALAAVLMMLLPVLLVAGLLWRTFATQVDDSYEKRISANLNLFELAVDQGLDDFRRALSRLTADNTIQVTVNHAYIVTAFEKCCLFPVLNIGQIQWIVA